MTPSSALVPTPVSSFTLTSSGEDFEAPLPSFVGLGLAAYASPDDLGALADRAEAGVSALQLIFDAQAAGAVELPGRLAEQLRQLMARATGRASETRPAGESSLALLS